MEFANISDEVINGAAKRTKMGLWVAEKFVWGTFNL